MAGGIFISYRRDDSRHAAGRLADRLGKTFPRDQLFMDVDNIDLGLDFVRVLDDKVAACDAMLVVIGPQWLLSRDAQGNRRLDDPRDFVRLEIEAALARDVRVIPVLVDGAPQIRAEELPASLAPLARRQATAISHERFGTDVERIVGALERIVFAGKQTTAAPSQSDTASTTGSSVTPKLIMQTARTLGPLKQAYYAPDIPSGKIDSARSVAGIPMAEEILVLFADITFRFEKKHVALTSAGIWAIKGWISRPKQKVMIGWKEFLAHPIRARALMKIAVGGAEIEYDGPTESVVSFLKQLQLEAAGC